MRAAVRPSPYGLTTSRAVEREARAIDGLADLDAVGRCSAAPRRRRAGLPVGCRRQPSARRVTAPRRARSTNCRRPRRPAPSGSGNAVGRATYRSGPAILAASPSRRGRHEISRPPVSAFGRVAHTMVSGGKRFAVPPAARRAATGLDRVRASRDETSAAGCAAQAWRRAPARVRRARAAVVVAGDRARGCRPRGSAADPRPVAAHAGPTSSLVTKCTCAIFVMAWRMDSSNAPSVVSPPAMCATGMPCTRQA